MLQAGDLILEQDPMRLEKVLTQQLALRDQAAARLAELERGPRPEAIREARARLESAQASAQNAADSLVRAEEIYARNLSDQATLDLATMRRKTTLAAEQAAKESLATLLNGHSKRLVLLPTGHSSTWIVCSCLHPLMACWINACTSWVNAHKLVPQLQSSWMLPGAMREFMYLNHGAQRFSPASNLM
jgi:multidrug efflux pump subunit AcrA (membrane-fusion protein)